MTIALLSEKLSFVRLRTGKIHGHDSKWAYTMCGKTIPDGTPPLSYRRIGEASVCGLCVRSLRIYTRGTPPQVQFEQKEREEKT